MLCRAHLLIEKEYQQFKKEHPWGIEAELVSDSIYDWSVEIQGPKNSLYEGGVFLVYMKFSEHYNDRPPEIFFRTIPFHPNIDPETGQLCVDFLEVPGIWAESYTFGTALTDVQNILGSPVIDSEGSANPEAVSLLEHEPEVYRDLAAQCVHNSRVLGENPQLFQTPRPLALEKENTRVTFATRETRVISPDYKPARAQQKKAKVSFEDYHNTWKSLGTSLPNTKESNPRLSTYEGDLGLLAPRPGLTQDEIEEMMAVRAEEHQRIMYGTRNPHVANNQKQTKKSKLAAIDSMRRLYLPPRDPTPGPDSPAPRAAAHDTTTNSVVDPEDQEADDLLEWSKSLDEEKV